MRFRDGHQRDYANSSDKYGGFDLGLLGWDKTKMAVQHQMVAPCCARSLEPKEMLREKLAPSEERFLGYGMLQRLRFFGIYDEVNEMKVLISSIGRQE